MVIQLPSVKINHLNNMTDCTGLFQFADFSIPLRKEGYTTDDNARALVACVWYNRLKKDQKIEDLANVYLAFLKYMQKPGGYFHNYLSFERKFLDASGSADSVGRSLWGLGCAVNSSFPKQTRAACKEIFDNGLPWVWKTKSPRFIASTILGLSQYHQAYPQGSAAESAENLADKLVKLYRNETKGDWQWFENCLTYDNARLPQALFEAYMLSGKREHLEAAEESMGFLIKTQMLNGVFVPIGSDGWYKRGGKRAMYDQQPIEAAAMVEAAVDAFWATSNKDYAQVANSVFEWFFGGNSLKAPLYCADTGGCFDGLRPGGLNMNQGAESSVSYLLARLKLEQLKRDGLGRKT